MGLEFFEKAVAYQQQYLRPGMKVTNAFQTNGTILNDDWCAFFKQHNFLVGISIDGPEDLHDAYRKDKAGEPSFQRVKEGFYLLQKHAVEFNIMATVHAANAKHPLDVYCFFRDELGAQFIQFIPIVERDNKSGYQKGNKIILAKLCN